MNQQQVGLGVPIGADYGRVAQRAADSPSRLELDERQILGNLEDCADGSDRHRSLDSELELDPVAVDRRSRGGQRQAPDFRARRHLTTPGRGAVREEKDQHVVGVDDRERSVPVGIDQIRRTGTGGGSAEKHEIERVRYVREAKATTRIEVATLLTVDRPTAPRD